MATSGSGGGATLGMVSKAQCWLNGQPHKGSDAVFIQLHSKGVIDGKVCTGVGGVVLG
jgi:hypothetical protein